MSEKRLNTLTEDCVERMTTISTKRGAAKDILAKYHETYMRNINEQLAEDLGWVGRLESRCMVEVVKILKDNKGRWGRVPRGKPVRIKILMQGGVHIIWSESRCGSCYDQSNLERLFPGDHKPRPENPLLYTDAESGLDSAYQEFTEVCPEATKMIAKGLDMIQNKLDELGYKGNWQSDFNETEENRKMKERKK